MPFECLHRRLRLTGDNRVEYLHMLLHEGIMLRQRHLDAEDMLAEGQRTAGPLQRAEQFAVPTERSRRTCKSYSRSFMSLALTFG